MQNTDPLTQVFLPRQGAFLCLNVWPYQLRRFLSGHGLSLSWSTIYADAASSAQEGSPSSAKRPCGTLLPNGRFLRTPTNRSLIRKHSISSSVFKTGAGDLLRSVRCRYSPECGTLSAWSISHNKSKKKRHSLHDRKLCRILLSTFRPYVNADLACPCALSCYSFA